MAARKKTRKAAPEKSKAGRKKEIKRFEMEIATSESGFELEDNEVAFIVRTSGGTPLNPTDTGKIHRLVQHELRALGHRLKRKGQELDPIEERNEESISEPPPTDDLGEPSPADALQDEGGTSSESSNPVHADPDDPDGHGVTSADSSNSATTTPQ